MGVGQELANAAIEKGKNYLKDMGKKIAGALLKNPYFYIVLAVIFLIIIVAGTMVDINASAPSNTAGMNNANTASGMSVNQANISREDFIQCVTEYRDDEGYRTRFAQYADEIYDICTQKNVNPVLCVAQASNESGFGASVPNNSQWNYWGLGVYNNSSEGIEYDSINEAIEGYCDIILSYQQEGSIAYAKAQIYAEYSTKITGNMNSIYDILCAYAFLGNIHNDTIWGSVNAKTYLVDYMNFPCSHELAEATTLEEQAAYAVDYVDKHIIEVAIDIFGESIINRLSGNIELYNADGTVNEEKIQELQLWLEAEYNLVTASSSGNNIGGQYNRENCERVTGNYLGFNSWINDGGTNIPISNSGGIIYQCPWWANGRASEYLGQNVSIGGHGGQIFNNAEGLYRRGDIPKSNSLVVYSGGDYGHVAYVEAVDEVNRYYYISHAGNGESWFGIQKVPFGGAPWSGYSLTGFVYIDEPLE